MERPVFVITGASAGIGRAAAVALAPIGQVVLVGRDERRLHDALDAVRAAGGADAVAHRCDFADLGDVGELAVKLRELDRVDVLANNAGLLATSASTTVDGFETTMQVNHLAGFLLAHLLRDRLSGGRLITTTSAMHVQGRLDPPVFTTRDRFSRWRAYADSKQANVHFTREAARRWPDITPACFHPGAVRSRFGDENGLFRLVKKMPGFFVSPESGADTLVWLATTDDAVTRGGYYVRRRLRRPGGKAGDDALAKRLWDRGAETLAL
ncbi:short-chain dehydrogenase [Actinorhabdospora filicis]|uniref:Short-chain dehydrogenase n=1 Tax=Actinorhabdospora filicis TaxID=1785913 RepID=A0A9W6SS39_9ACTN|nr:SDR family NAD(P)-dependent oxidoreductase [Actinorhabdospora filicis]GLZ81884.1 short-chain dehydrogenase [Actinorhabdospora filicis]